MGIPALPLPLDQAEVDEAIEIKGARGFRPLRQSGILPVVDVAVGIDVGED